MFTVCTITGSSYKFIFISDDDWKKFMESYDKTKKYDIIDETEYINYNLRNRFTNNI